MASLAGFTVLPISYGSTTTHYLYARAHAGSKSKKKSASASAQTELPEGRTLFLVNVPPDATERELSLLFKSAGTVERVIFDLDAAPEVLAAEDEDSDEDEDEDDEEDGEEDVQETEEQPRKRRKLSKKNEKPQPPAVVPLPLPSIPVRRLRPTGRTVHLVFLDESSLARALDAPSSSSTSTGAPSPAKEKGKSKPRPWPSSEEPTGLAHYTALYTALRPPLDAVRAHADSYMARFEFDQARDRARASRYKKGEAIVDEDGFTLVTRGGAYGQTLGGGVAVASKKFQETGDTTNGRGRRKEKKEKSNFYAFQKAEKQRNDLLELKKNWEADKAKVEQLRAKRKFKPY